MDIVLLLVAVLAAFYFILLKPVMEQQKRQKQDISSLEVGDEVLTSAGFYATVLEINTFEDRPMEILLEVADGVVLRGTTLAIQQITQRAADLDDALDDDFEDYEDDLEGSDAGDLPAAEGIEDNAADDDSSAERETDESASDPKRGSRS